MSSVISKFNRSRPACKNGGLFDGGCLSGLFKSGSGGLFGLI